MELSNTTASSFIELLQQTENAGPDEAKKQIHFEAQGSKYVTGGANVTGFQAMAKAFFRGAEEKKANQATINRVKEEIKSIFGQNSEAVQKFDEAFNSKLSWGSPLTKGALLRFKKSLSETDQKTLQIKISTGQTPLEESNINAKACLAKARAEELEDVTERSYWKKAENFYSDQSSALQRGDKKEAARCREVAEGYRKTAMAYGEGKKDLAHYLIEETEFLKAEGTSLKEGKAKEAKNFSDIRSWYSAAIEAEGEGFPKAAQCYSKVAKCFEEANKTIYPKERNRLLTAARIYEEAAWFALQRDADTATQMTKRIDEENVSLFENYPRR